MSEIKRTGLFAGVAVVLAVLAFALSPRSITPEAFMDQGELFFPEFTDPNAAQTMEVIEYDPDAGASRPFKVTFKNGIWTIPSHYDYPADAKDQLAKTAAGVMVIRKDDYRTNNVVDHEVCGVIDPLDTESPSLAGRGSRLTLKGDNEQVLADLIIGKAVPERQGFRFVRVPGENRVYAAKVDLNVSTRFQDWIETNLIKVDKNKIDGVTFNNYSINERTLSVEPGTTTELQKVDGEWTVSPRPKARHELDVTKVNQLLRSLEGLSIVGVRPKPQGLSTSLTKEGPAELSQADRVSLQSKGFYVGRDGRLLSNEGEVLVRTTEGVLYTLRFGEVLYGSGLDVSAGTDVTGGRKTDESQAANRYLFVTADFDNGYFKAPPKPQSLDFRKKAESDWSDFDKDCKEASDKYDAYAKKVEDGKKLADSLNQRFATWYYVIAESSFDNVHLTQSDLVKSTEG